MDFPRIKEVAKQLVAQGYRNTDPTAMEQALQAGKVDVIAGLRYSITPTPTFLERSWKIEPAICASASCCRCLDDVVRSG